jgi:hypothetical protein
MGWCVTSVYIEGKIFEKIHRFSKINRDILLYFYSYLKKIHKFSIKKKKNRIKRFVFVTKKRFVL